MRLVYDPKGLFKWTLDTSSNDLTELADSIRAALESSDLEVEDKRDFLKNLAGLTGLTVTSQDELDNILASLDNSKNVWEDAKAQSGVDTDKDEVSVISADTVKPYVDDVKKASHPLLDDKEENDSTENSGESMDG